MKTLLSRWSWIRLFEGILLIVLGILVGTIGGTHPENMTNALSIIIAVFLFLDAAVTLFGYIVNPTKNFSFECVIGAVFIGVGAVLCTEAGQASLVTLVSIFVIAVMMASAVAFLVKGIVSCIYKAPVGWIVVNFLVFVLAGVLGSTALYYYLAEPQLIEKIIYIILGIAICVLGVFDIVFAYKGIKKAREKAAETKQAETKIVDADEYEKLDDNIPDVQISNEDVGKIENAEVKEIENKDVKELDKKDDNVEEDKE